MIQSHGLVKLGELLRTIIRSLCHYVNYHKYLEFMFFRVHFICHEFTHYSI